jgi:transposase
MAWTVAIGVDTHKDAHVAVALDVVGVELDHCVVEATLAGYRRLLSWAALLGEPAFAVEGCGSYGAGLARFLETAEHLVWECERPRRGDRKRGKNDLIDAALAARRLLSGSGLSSSRGGGQREHLRVLLVERRGAIQARTAAINQLHALIVTAPDALRERLSGLSQPRLVTTAARLQVSADGVGEVLRRIAKRAQSLSQEIVEIERSLQRLVAELAPHLLTECGVGVVCAAQLLVSSGNATRMKARPRLRPSPARAPSMPRAANSSATASTAAATASSTGRST